jgi:hypothetical protein
MREVDDSEEEREKNTLSLSILNFLKIASNDKRLRQQLVRSSDFLYENLKAEQKSIQKWKKCPIDLESTQLGSQMQVLRELLAGKDHTGIMPYNFLSYRVIARMADLLEDHVPSNFAFEKFDVDITIEDLFEH